MTEDNAVKLDKLVKQLARLIHKAAEEGLSVDEPKLRKPANLPRWQSAFIDMRLFADANGHTSKLRAVLINGELYGRLRSTAEISKLKHEIEKLRRADETANWFGLKIVVTPKGTCTYEFDTNPDCVVDPTWYKS